MTPRLTHGLDNADERMKTAHVPSRAVAKIETPMSRMEIQYALDVLLAERAANKRPKLP